MSDSADELILKMQHLEAQAKEGLEARALRAGLDRLRSGPQKLAWDCEKELSTLEKVVEDAENRLDELRVGGVSGAEAPEYLAVKGRADDAKKKLVRLRAQLNFAMDRMEVAERREYEAFHAEVRAETHGQMADDPLFDKKLDGR